MGIDSELNAIWETPRPHDRGGQRHPPGAGQPDGRAPGPVGAGRRWPGWAARRAWWPYLDALVEAGRGRLRAHPSPTPAETRVLEVIDPQALPFDPERPDEDETIESADEQRSLFKRGLSALWDRPRDRFA